MSTAMDERVERAITVGVELPGSDGSHTETLAELERLVWTAGAKTVGSVTQKTRAINPRTFVGSGKAAEIAELAHALNADIVVFDEELTPSQQSNLEKLMGNDVKVIDRTALILDIFALHATTKEGRLQVRLAQNQYLLPRLRGMWAHLASNRMGGGVGSRFGEGESQLEVDRRMVRKRITQIKRELEHLDRNRSIQRKERQRSGVYRVALAGYTNAGKSSLLNRLTDANVLSYDKLFATLDSTTRRYQLPEGREIAITDTVGFIQKLPTSLIESFKSTLDEIREADLIVHVVDASSANIESQMRAVGETLQQIRSQDKARLLVFNKIDLLDEEHLLALENRYPEATFLSTVSGDGIETLVGRISHAAASADATVSVLVPYDKSGIVSHAHANGFIIQEQYTPDGTAMTLRASGHLLAELKPYLTCL